MGPMAYNVPGDAMYSWKTDVKSENEPFPCWLRKNMEDENLSLNIRRPNALVSTLLDGSRTRWYSHGSVVHEASRSKDQPYSQVFWSSDQSCKLGYSGTWCRDMVGRGQPTGFRTRFVPMPPTFVWRMEITVSVGLCPWETTATNNVWFQFKRPLWLSMTFG